MACACRVITSKTGTCPEMAGGAAVLVDPLDVQNIADGALSVLIDGPDLRIAGPGGGAGTDHYPVRSFAFPPPTVRLSSHLALMLRFTVSVGLLVAVCSKLQLPVLLEKARAIHWIYFWIAFVVAHMDRLIMAFKWRLLAQSIGV